MAANRVAERLSHGRDRARRDAQVSDAEVGRRGDLQGAGVVGLGSGIGIRLDHLVGDICDEEGEPACAMDKKELLHCKAGKFTKVRACKRCTPFLDKVECD